MIIGVPKEVKNKENRVGLVPGGVKQLVKAGHQVLVEKDAGQGVGIADDVYQSAGARIVANVNDVWGDAQMIIKVKEPIEQEYARMREGQILYTYLHLAACPELAKVFLERKVTAIAYETIQLPDRSLPLLKPMSEVAGRMSLQAGARALEKHNGGKGLLIGGVPGVRRAKVAIIGGGVVGTNAAKIAIGMGALVTILDVDQKRLAYLDDIFASQVTTLMSNPENIADSVRQADLVIGAVLVTGAKAPVLVSKDMVLSMEKGSAIVDVAIDQGGSVETIRPTTLAEPMFNFGGINHYGVTNIPGDVPVTSTYALTNVTLPYALNLANLGLERAMREDFSLKLGLNTHQGSITHPAVASALGYSYHKVDF